MIIDLSSHTKEHVETVVKVAAPKLEQVSAQLREQAEAMRAGNVRLLLNELAVYKGQYAGLQTELAAARAQP